MQGEMDDGGELEGWVEVQWRKRRRGDMEVKEIGRKKKPEVERKRARGRLKNMSQQREIK